MRALKLRIIIVIVLFCAAACSDKDTEPHDVWPRTVEPRLTGEFSWQPCTASLAPGHAVPAAACGPKKSPSMECDEPVTNGSQAVRLLASQSACTDAAIAALENLARVSPPAISDLAAAYYVRAQREDRPSDLLLAFDAAEEAVNVLPRSPAAHFNRALIAETLGLPDESIASWNKVLQLDHSQWATEAREHLGRLQREPSMTAAARWAHNRAQLPGSTPEAAARLIAPFQLTAERHLEDELLPQWAQAPTPQRLNEAKTLATALWKLSDDRFALDVVESIERSPRSSTKGLLAFGTARHATTDRAVLNDKATRLLEVTHSPLSLLTRLGYANAIALGAWAKARALLDPVEREATKHRYRHLIARIRATRAYYLGYESRYLESLAESDAAIATFDHLGDTESAVDARMRRIGVIDTAGQHEIAWRNALEISRDSTRLADAQARHNALGTCAESALAMGHARIALLYQNAAFRLIQRQLASIPPEDLSNIHRMQANLGTALRARARIELKLNNYESASADLAEAMRLGAKEDIDPSVRSTMGARIQEVNGQALLRISPARSADAFTQALRLTGTEFLTFRASLFAQRADAMRRAGRNADAEADLKAAVAELGEEEKRILERRKRGTNEELWSAYFSRFRETYSNLIRQLLEEGRAGEAFDYAERARAFEPLNLVASAIPREFDGTTKKLAEIQASLAPDTLLIEYSVLDDQTVAWLVSRDGFQVIRLNAPRRDVERGSAALQRAASARNHSDFETQLYVLYDKLMAGPLTRIGKMPARLVIVPDGPMHGLPFAALHNPRTNRYLIEDVPLEIAGSANLYLVSLARDKALASNKTPSILLIGNPAFNVELAVAQGLHPLHHARRECERIYEMYSPHAQMRLEREATIPQFLSLAKSSAIIHVAAHTIVNAQAPSQSFILLAPAADQPGPLDAQALVTMPGLDHVRLVVLSTCSSAGGVPVGAEGVAPLVRPLIGAGVPAVVGTLWNVEDATAEELLVSFHRHYRQGSDAALAMQQAQLELLRNKNNNPGLRSVFAWAPFQVIGHSSSPFATTPQHKEKPP